MKDKKFVVLCAMGGVWLAMFIAMMAGAKIHRNVETMVIVLCLCWFAYWTLSTVRNYFRTQNTVTPTNPPTVTHTNPPQQTNESNEPENVSEKV